MSQSRKDEHIKLALNQEIKSNYFDAIILESTDLPDISIDEIDLSTEFLGYHIKLPIYINAMTGGSDKGLKINDFLSKIASHFDLPMVSGSQSIIFKEPQSIPSFEIIRKNHHGLVVANLNANATVDMAKKAVNLLGAQALSIHLNVIQEVLMEEGDRDFRQWSTHLKDILEQSHVPLLVKQVGIGFSNQTILKLQKLGIKYVDISGSGGTSFLDIESKRSQKDYRYLNEFNLETAKILLNLPKDLTLKVYASGGIRHPLDVIKALILGANAVGLSRWFLELTQLSFKEAVASVEDFILDLKKIMIILGVKNIYELRKVSFKIKEK